METSIVPRRNIHERYRLDYRFCLSDAMLVTFLLEYQYQDQANESRVYCDSKIFLFLIKRFQQIAESRAYISTKLNETTLCYNKKLLIMPAIMRYHP